MGQKQGTERLANLRVIIDEQNAAFVDGHCSCLVS
jgi:hypothetical protein